MKKICVLSLIVLFLASIAFAGTVNLPRTGQTKCYDTAGAEIPCSGTGQDGEIQAGVPWPNPRFADNDDGTMTDNLTGLVWTSNANIMPTRDPGWDTEGTADDGAVTWQHALDYVAKLNAEGYLGYSDWRLPNVNELESLINTNEGDSDDWLRTQGFTNVSTSYYWPSTSCTFNPVAVWHVFISIGNMYDRSKSDSYNCYVWPVRGGQDFPAPA